METTDLLTFLINSLWQVPLVTALAAALAWLMRHGPASYRHAVWVAALAVAVLLPLASLRTVSHKVTPVGAVPALTQSSAALLAASTPATPASTRKAIASEPMMVPFAARTARTVLIAYAAFLFLRFALLGLAWMRTVQIRRTARLCDVSAPVRTAWTRCLRAFGLGTVALLASPTAPGPLMAGAWRRSVIVPDSLLAETSEDVLATALGHEAAHAARHDFFVNVLCELLYIPISFNPVAWILRRGIERTREMACDEMVTSHLLDARTYARAIVGLAARMKNPARPGYALGVFDGDILEERIRRLVERRPILRRARLVLVTGLSALAVCAVVASGLALSARAQNGARPELVRGVQAFNSGDYQGAIQHFGVAVQLDPANLIAKLHLANAYSAAAFSDASNQSQGRDWLLENARRQYEDVLSLDPANPPAILGLTSLAKPEDLSRSRELLKRLISADPKNASAYYYLAVKAWSYAYPLIQQALKAAGIPPQAAGGPLPDPTARKALEEQVKLQLEEGVTAAQTAIQLDPGSSDSMAYLNLLFRSLAVVQDDPWASKSLIEKADELVGQAIAAKREAGSRSASRAIVDADSAPPLMSSIRVAPPPPPPPPPPGYQGPPGVPMPAGFDPGSYWEVATREKDAVTETAGNVVNHLRSLGFAAGIMLRGSDNLNHVVVGPYKDKATLDSVKSKLVELGFSPVLR